MSIRSRITAAISAFRGQRLPGGPSLWDATWRASIGQPSYPSSDIPTPDQAMGISAVYAAISLLSGTLSATELQHIRRTGTGATEKVTTGAVSIALGEWSMVDVEAGLIDAFLTGNGYWRKVRDDRKATARLEWLPAWRVSLEISDDGTLRYAVQEDGTVNEPALSLLPADVVHLKFRLHGRHRHLGVSPLVTCAPSLGLVHVTRRAGSSLYANLSAPSVILKHPGRINEEGLRRIKDRWLELHSVRHGKAGEPSVLAEGMDAGILQLGKAIDVQLEEMTRLGVAEVSRVLGVPLHLLGEPGSVNFSTATESQRAFVSTSLKPWAKRFSDCLSHALLSRDARLAGERVTLDLTPLTRGEGQELADFLSKLTNGGIASVNESREMVGLPPVQGGDATRAPVNTMPLENWLDYDPGATEPEPPPERSAQQAATLKLVKSPRLSEESDKDRSPVQRLLTRELRS